MAHDWSRASSGVVLFGGAMVARAVVVTIGLVQILRGELSDIPLAFGLAVALGEIATTIIGAAGILRFGRAIPQPARKQASFAALCVASMVAAECYALWVGLRVRELGTHGVGEVSLSPELAAHLARVPTVATIAMVAGFLGLILVLLAIGSVAEDLHAEPLTKRAGDLVIALLGFALAYAIVMNVPALASGWIAVASLLGLAAFGIGVLAANVWLYARIVRLMRAA